MNHTIAFKDLTFDDATGFSKLFLTYIDNYESIAEFYNGNFRSNDDWKAHIETLQNRKIDRSALVRILLNQNRDFQCGVKTLANIDLLVNDTTFAVVTGQQVGLCTGPLYTIYKAITAILLAEKLTEQYPHYNFVPVFWLESEDHDLEEASSFTLFTKTGELATYTYEPERKTVQKNVGAVGSLVLDDSISALFNELQNSLLPTEFSTKVLDAFRSAYMPGMTFTRAFVHMFNVLLENSGLIFFDPNTTEAKQLVKHIFEFELHNVSHTSQLVITQSERLEQVYHAQVKPRAVNLFLHHNTGRYAIEPKENGFFLKGTRQQYSTQKMYDLLNTHPEVFSPNVVLRPICQDTIFPTISYVAGPSEIAYFAQFKPVYEHFCIPMPIIYPRASITILEERPAEILQKYHLSMLDAFQEKELIKKRVIENLSDFKIDILFSNTQGTIEESLQTLKDGLEKIDPTLVPALTHTLERMLHNLNVLKEKTFAAQNRQHETAMRQIDKAIDSIFPHSRLQERVLNVMYYLNKYGWEFLRWVQSEMNISIFKHQILEV